MKSIYKKIIGFFIAASIIATPIVLLSINWTNLSILYATGSSAVFPLMKELSKTYQSNRSSNPSIDVNVENTGSGNGLEKIIDNKANFGNLSFSPSKELVEQHKDSWEKNRTKTISWGMEGIAVVYKGDFEFDINEKNISDIYCAFSGVKEYKFSDLGVKGNGADLNVIPYSRTGGADKSGTTEAFISDSGFSLDLNTNQLLADAMQRLENGKYGDNVKQTAESQSQSWSQISSSKSDGSMIYLATGFVTQNIKEIHDKGFKVATYNGNEMNKDNIRDGKYNWRRVLNSLVNLSENNSSLIEWVNWIFSNYDKSFLIEAFEKAGIIQFNEEQLKQMCKDQNNPKTFWMSDLEIKPLDGLPSGFCYGVWLENNQPLISEFFSSHGSEGIND